MHVIKYHPYEAPSEVLIPPVRCFGRCCCCHMQNTTLEETPPKNQVLSKDMYLYLTNLRYLPLHVYRSPSFQSSATLKVLPSL